MRGPVERIVEASIGVWFLARGPYTAGPSEMALKNAVDAVAQHAAEIDRAWAERAALLAVEQAARACLWAFAPGGPLHDSLAALDKVRHGE